MSKQSRKSGVPFLSRRNTKEDRKESRRPSDEVDYTKKLLEYFMRRKALRNALDKLKTFGIPDQKELLEKILSDDPISYDFGGHMSEYLSYCLDSYALINMQDRYRGVNKSHPCFMNVNVDKVPPKGELQRKETLKKRILMNKKLDELKAAAFDEDHFQYIRNLAFIQPITIPMTINYGIMKEVVPMMSDLRDFYAKKLRKEHANLEKVSERFMSLRRRMKMYARILDDSK